jgi:hypothetical protein
MAGSLLGDLYEALLDELDRPRHRIEVDLHIGQQIDIAPRADA